MNSQFLHGFRVNVKRFQYGALAKQRLKQTIKLLSHIVHENHVKIRHS